MLVKNLMLASLYEIEKNFHCYLSYSQVKDVSALTFWLQRFDTDGLKPLHKSLEWLGATFGHRWFAAHVLQPSCFGSTIWNLMVCR